MSNLAVHYLPVHGRPDDVDLIRQVSNRLVKYAPAGKPDINGLRTVWELLDPDGILILRNVAMSNQTSDVVHDAVGTAHRHAREWLEQIQAYPFLDPNRVRIEGANEVPMWDGIPPSVCTDYNCAFADDLNAGGWLVMLGQINTGWPANSGPDTPSNWQPFDAMIDRASWDGNWLGLHEYFGTSGPRGLMNGWWAYRYRHLLDYCRQTGRTHPPVVVSELGMAKETRHDDGSWGQKPTHGWIGALSPAQYMSHLLKYAEDSAVDGVIGACVFTTDGARPWIQTMDTQGIHELWMASGEQTLGTMPINQDQQVNVPIVIVDGPDTSFGEPEFQRVMAFILKWEGEELTVDSNGAPVKFGINQGANPDIDVAQLTKSQALRIYFDRYWKASGADKLSWPMNLAHMNAAVNTGAVQAGRFLKTADGSLGRYVLNQMDWYESLTMFEQYGEAWRNRMIDLVDTAVTGG